MHIPKGKRVVKTKQNRQELILDIISKNAVETQEQLIEMLGEE